MSYLPRGPVLTWTLTSAYTSMASNAQAMESVINEADRLYESLRYDQVYDLLIQHKDEGSDEILWRLTRATFEQSKVATTKPDKQSLANEAYRYIKDALEINPNNFAVHKWMAIMIDTTSIYEGYKARVVNSSASLEHMQKAIELNPKDAGTFYLLGAWYFNYADLTVPQRKLATAMFGPLPDASYEQALDYFLKAEEVEPESSISNLMMLGKTYSKMGNAQKAEVYLQSALKCEVRTKDDTDSRDEATKLLKKIQDHERPQS